MANSAKRCCASWCIAFIVAAILLSIGVWQTVIDTKHIKERVELNIQNHCANLTYYLYNECSTKEWKNQESKWIIFDVIVPLFIFILIPVITGECPKKKNSKQNEETSHQQTSEHVKLVEATPPNACHLAPSAPDLEGQPSQI